MLQIDQSQRGWTDAGGDPFVRRPLQGKAEHPMTTTSTTKEVADAIRAVGPDRQRMRELMEGFYAETIRIQHEPALPSDGAVPASVLVTLGAQEVAASERALYEIRVTHHEVVVDDGDRIRV